MKRNSPASQCLLRFLVLIATFEWTSATAALIQVNSTLGSTDISSCTLANAFAAASQKVSVGTCTVGDGDDVIELPSNSTITLTGTSGDYGGSLLSAVKQTLLVVGNGSTVSSTYASCSDTGPGHRLMSVLAGAKLYINDLTLTNGCANDTYDGGAIYASGSLDLENVTFANNASTSNGGAIAVYGPTLQISDSTFTGNVALNDGGAVFSWTTPTAVITASTFANNSGDHGGGVSAFGIQVSNSTFVGNHGVAIDAGTGPISFSTFMGNDTAVFAESGFPQGLAVANSILVKAPGGEPTFNCGVAINGVNNGVLTFLNANISDDESCGGSAVVPSQSVLAFGALGMYGGTTATIPLGVGSVAIGAATTCTDATGAPEYVDQRGSARNAFGTCDVGAFQHDAATYPIVTPAPLGAGNLLISNGSYVSEYTRSGIHVRDFWPVLRPPYPASPIAVDANGLTDFGVFLDGYNGDAFGRYNVTSDAWIKTTYADWSDYGGYAANKIAHSGNRWFLTAKVNNLEGSIDVIENGVEIGWLSPNQQINDLKMGLDGYLYILMGSMGSIVQAFDPNTLQAVHSVDMSGSLNGNGFGSLAVGHAGEMYLYRSDGLIMKFDKNGTLLGSTNCVVPGNTAPCSDVREIALSQDHMLFMVPTLGAPPYLQPVIAVDDAFTSGSNFTLPLEPSGANTLVISPLLPDEIFRDGFGP